MECPEVRALGEAAGAYSRALSCPMFAPKIHAHELDLPLHDAGRGMNQAPHTGNWKMPHGVQAFVWPHFATVKSHLIGEYASTSLLIQACDIRKICMRWFELARLFPSADHVSPKPIRRPFHIPPHCFYGFLLNISLGVLARLRPSLSSD